MWKIGLGGSLGNTIKLSKNKIDSKVMKSHQYSLEKSHAVSIELNSELYQDLPLFKQKQILRSTSHKH